MVILAQQDGKIYDLIDAVIREFPGNADLFSATWKLVKNNQKSNKLHIPEVESSYMDDHRYEDLLRRIIELETKCRNIINRLDLLIHTSAPPGSVDMRTIMIGIIVAIAIYIFIWSVRGG